MNNIMVAVCTACDSLVYDGNSYSWILLNTSNPTSINELTLDYVKKNEPEIFKKIYKVLLPKDYLRFRLSGDFFTDMSDASGTLWFNVKNRDWSSDLLNLTSLSEDNMPKLVEGTECSTYIDKKLANKFGFKNDVIIAG